MALPTRPHTIRLVSTGPNSRDTAMSTVDHALHADAFEGVDRLQGEHTPGEKPGKPNNEQRPETNELSLLQNQSKAVRWARSCRDGAHEKHHDRADVLHQGDRPDAYQGQGIARNGHTGLPT
jgi:hypothetical protein